MLYNGFNSDLETFAKFIFIYENQIKSMNNKADFSILSQGALHFFSTNIQPVVKYVKANKFAVQPVSSKHTLFFTKNKNQILDFCRHFRNSFCHILLQKSGTTSIIIRDNYNGDATCDGTLEHNVLIQFITQIINDYEMTEKNNSTKQS